MIRPFGLSDVLLVRRLQHSSVPLAIEQILTHPQAPVRIALTAPWPWAGVGVATYVLDEAGAGERLTGFVQLMKRASRPEADLLHLAPALALMAADDMRAETIWRKLLAHCCLAAAGRGVQRIFASIPDGGPEESCLKDGGFSLYTRETIYRLASSAEQRRRQAPTPVPAGFRPQLPQDSWALQRLYARSAPRLVQQAEGAGGGRAAVGEAGSPPLSWWDPGRWQGAVSEPAGEVRGAVQVHIGRAGHWLRVWGANLLVARELRELVEQGLRLIAAAEAPGRRGRQPSPVYATVRDYEIGMSGTLTGFGFAPYLDRARFVKHTAARAAARETGREPLPAALTAMEARQEAAAVGSRVAVQSQLNRTQQRQPPWEAGSAAGAGGPRG